MSLPQRVRRGAGSPFVHSGQRTVQPQFRGVAEEALCCDALGSCGILRVLSSGGCALALLPRWGALASCLVAPSQVLFLALGTWRMSQQGVRSWASECWGTWVGAAV